MYAIAIDIGGTKIEGALVDNNGKIISTKRIATQAEDGKKKILKNIEFLINTIKKNKNIEGIGMSMPGFIDSSGKVLFGGGTLSCLIGVNLKKEIRKITNLPVFLENDANCFALAEAIYGAGKKHRVVLGVIWGTGIGGGIVINKKVFSGANGAAGEFGHNIVDLYLKNGKKCGCGQYGCLENLASGKSIVDVYYSTGGVIKNANPRKIYFSSEKVAKETMNKAIFYLGIGISNLVNTLNPDIIVFGGGVSKLPNPVYKKIEKEIKKATLSVLTKNLKIARHKISDSAGIVGAAALVFQENNKKVC